jgi:hypothetical protein
LGIVSRVPDREVPLARVAAVPNDETEDTVNCTSVDTTVVVAPPWFAVYRRRQYRDSAEKPFKVTGVVAVALETAWVDTVVHSLSGAVREEAIWTSTLEGWGAVEPVNCWPKPMDVTGADHPRSKLRYGVGYMFPTFNVTTLPLTHDTTPTESHQTGATVVVAEQQDPVPVHPADDRGINRPLVTSLGASLSTKSSNTALTVQLALVRTPGASDNRTVRAAD